MLSDDDYLKLVDEYEYSYKQGDIVEGTVIGYEGNFVLVDIKAKACAYCPFSEVYHDKFSNIQDVFEIAKTYQFAINSPETEDGFFYLSHRKVAMYNNIKLLEEKFKNDETIIAPVVNIVKGGIIVNVLGLKGFVPQSQLRINDVNIDDNIELKIIALDLDKNNFILSNKKVYNDLAETSKKEVFDKIELNMVVKGRVVRITDFGAFIDIGGVDGLLPLSQISWKWIDNPSVILKPDDTINVEIIGIDKDKQRISLSLKSLEENPWPKAAEFIEDGKTVKGKVTAIKPFGAFVEVYPNVEGLLNKTQINHYNNKNKKYLEENDEIDVLVKKFDCENQKINLEII